MNKIQKTAGTVALLTVLSGMAYAGSLDVKVGGSVTPAGCKFNLSNGGTIDYGNIQTSTLNSDKFTDLDEKRIDITITCVAPTKLALTAKSGRGQSAVNLDGTLAEITLNPNRIPAAGLGMHEGKGIGGYSLSLVKDSFTADGNRQKLNISSRDPSVGGWGVPTYGTLMSSSPIFVSWGEPGHYSPMPFTSITGKLAVRAYINKASELDLNKPVKLDGLATIEMVYL